MAENIASSVVLGVYEKGAENETDILLTEENVNDIETTELKESMNELRAKFPKEVIREVAKLRNQLGHLAPNKLAVALIDAKKPQEHSACARLFMRENCLRRKEPGLFRVAASPKASHFNEVLDTDSMWVIWNKKKYRIMSIMDEFSRYEVDALLPTETAAEEMKILEEKWINWAGAPRVLRLDMSGPRVPGDFRE